MNEAILKQNLVQNKNEKTNTIEDQEKQRKRQEKQKTKNEKQKQKTKQLLKEKIKFVLDVMSNIDNDKDKLILIPNQLYHLFIFED